MYHQLSDSEQHVLRTEFKWEDLPISFLKTTPKEETGKSSDKEVKAVCNSAFYGAIYFAITKTFIRRKNCLWQPREIYGRSVTNLSLQQQDFDLVSHNMSICVKIDTTTICGYITHFMIYPIKSPWVNSCWIGEAS